MSDHHTNVVPNGSASESSQFRRLVYLLILVLSAGTQTAVVLQGRPLLSANDRSRWGTVWSLVERGTYQIDEIISQRGWDTIDKVRHEEHFYSTKPPLLSTVVAGLYWCVKGVTGWNLLENTVAVTRSILLVINVLPMLASLMVLIAFVERYARSDGTRIFVLATAAFATLLTAFLPTLNNHTLAAAAVLFAIYPAARILADSERGPWLFVGCGFWAAWACCLELPAALFGLALFLLLLRAAPRQTLTWFVPAAIVPLAGFFFTNFLATGGWKPFYLYYGTEKYVYVHEGIPSYWTQPTGIDSGPDSFPVYLMHCLVGHHGIFSLSPVFLLSIAGWVCARRQRTSRDNAVLWLGLVLTICVFSFYMTRTQNYNYGGRSVGLRWMLWLIPFWLIALIPAWEQWGRRRWFQTISVLMLAVSIYSAWSPLPNPWQNPWLFNWMSQNGWLKQYDIPIPQLDRPLWTWFRSIPSSPSWIELAGTGPDGSPRRLRLVSTQPESVQGRELCSLHVEMRNGNEGHQSETFVIDVEKFHEGRPPSEFLIHNEDDSELGASRFSSLCGLPQPKSYNAGRIRYLRTSLRADAFRCQRVAAQLTFPSPDENRPSKFRSDVWLCPDVPFGVLQIVTSVYDPATNELISRRHLQVVAASIDGGSRQK